MCTEIYDLKINYQEYPIIDLNEKIFFSWKLKSNVSNNFQQFYQIFLKYEESIIWKSGKILSRKTINIPYDGPQLEKETKYKWYVVIGTTQDEENIISSQQIFYTACDWTKSKWITYQGNRKDLYPVFSSNFTLNKKGLCQGILYISSLGIYDAKLNGNKVTKYSTKNIEVLNPGWTDYLSQINYQCFDVTKLIKEDNNLSVGIGNGWFLGDISKNSGYEQLFDDGEKKHSLILKLILRYEDGECKNICSSENNWEVKSAPEIIENDLYQGEIINFSNQLTDKEIFVDFPNFNQDIVKKKLTPNNSVKIYQHFDQKRKPASVYYYDINDMRDSPKLALGYFEITEIRSSNDILISPNRKYIFDFGQNTAAVFQIKFKNRTNRKNEIRIRTSEMINDGVKDFSKKNFGSDGPKNSIYTRNLSFEAGGECRSEEILLVDRKATIDYTPSYTIHGYRFIEISANSEIELVEIHQVPVSSLDKSTTILKTNNQAVNKLFENTLWSQKSNYMSLPTDCPQRSERVGWTGDVQIFLKTALRNYDTLAFLTQYLKSINSNKNSSIYKSIIPKAFIPFLSDVVSSGWSDIGIILPWELYNFSGNENYLKDYYDRMNIYMSAIGDLKSHETLYSETLFGDWLSFAPESLPYMNIIYRGYCAYIMKQVASILKDEVMENKYDYLYKIIKTYVQKEYVESSDSHFKLLTRTKDGVEKSFHGYDYVDNAQTGLLWFLKLKFYKDEKQKKLAINELVKSIENRNKEIRENFPDKSLSVGFLGINILLPVLAEVDEMNLAYDLLLSEDIPSWLYSVNNGTTTIWERWNSYSIEDSFGYASMNSFNHYSYGAVFEWVYNHVAGVKVELNKEFPIEIYPKIDKGTQYNTQERIKEVRYEFDSIIGKIMVDWQSDGNTLSHIKGSIPMNQRGILILKKAEVEHMNFLQKKVLKITESINKKGTKLIKIIIEANTIYLD